MDINNKPEEKEPEKVEVRELNDDELENVSGGSPGMINTNPRF